MSQQKRQWGYTLLELMMVVAVIGILASIAIPSYQDSIKKSRRTDAQTSLVALAAALERNYSLNSTYLGTSTGSDAGGSIPSATFFSSQSPIDGKTKFYNLRMVATTLSYTVRAIPIGTQAKDGWLCLTSANVKTWDSTNTQTCTGKAW